MAGFQLGTTICLLIGCFLHHAVCNVRHETMSNDLKHFLIILNSTIESGIYSNKNDLHTFLANYNEEARERLHQTELASWNYLTDMNAETERKLTTESIAYSQWATSKQDEVNKFFKNKAIFRNDKEQYYMLNLIHATGAPPVPDSKRKIREKADLEQEMQTIYANGHVMYNNKKLMLTPQLEEIMANVTKDNFNMLQMAWLGWRDAVGPEMGPLYKRWVELANEGAQDVGFKDMGHYWRKSGFMMDEIEPMVDNLYDQIKTFYELLHAHVRGKLVKLFPDKNLDPEGPIPAHLLGNMWAQEWTALINVVTPYPEVETYDVTAQMKAQGYDIIKMFREAEDFFVSLGLEKMTETFWEKSMFERPENKTVECHASAEDFFSSLCDDFRIKMCTSINMEDLKTIHHEMGHIQYFMNYCKQPPVYRNGANTAFHEAIGDTIALSAVSEKHLKDRLGLIVEDPNREFVEEEEKKRDINFLMKMALEKVAFLPFSLVVDKWRWRVFNGSIKPENYNSAWWELSYEYQGIVPPGDRTDSSYFDPGAKYHIASQVPYIRYFLSFIAQFQFHEALCKESRHSGVMHKCDIYGNANAGALLQSVLEVGQSQPWQTTMKMFTGTESFDAQALINYFRDLIQWLQDTYPNEEQRGWKGKR